MDFKKLLFPELSEFVRNNSLTPKRNSKDLTEQAAELFDQLSKNKDSIYTIPVVDLYLAALYSESGRSLDKKYTEGSLRSLNQQEKEKFSSDFGLDINDPNFSNRLIRIVRILGNLQTLPLINLPRLGIQSQICQLTDLGNNIVPLNWNMPNPPHPNNPNENYGKLTCLGEGNCFFHAFLRAVSKIYIESYDQPDTVSESDISNYETQGQVRLSFPVGTLNPPRRAVNRNPNQLYTVNNKTQFVNSLSVFRRNYACVFRRNLAGYLRTNQEGRALLLEKYPETHTIYKDQIRVEYKERGQDISEQEIDKMATDQTVEYFLETISRPGQYIEPNISIILSELYGYDIYILQDRLISNPTSPYPYPGDDTLSSVRGPKNLRPPGDKFLDEEERFSIIIIQIGGIEGHYDLVVKSDRDGDIVTKFKSDEPIITNLYMHLIRSRILSEYSILEGVFSRGEIGTFTKRDDLKYITNFEIHELVDKYGRSYLIEGTYDNNTEMFYPP